MQNVSTSSWGNRISVKLLLFPIILAEHYANSEQVEKMTGMKGCQDMQPLKNQTKFENQDLKHLVHCPSRLGIKSKLKSYMFIFEP